MIDQVEKDLPSTHGEQAIHNVATKWLKQSLRSAVSNASRRKGLVAGILGICLCAAAYASGAGKQPEPAATKAATQELQLILTDAKLEALGRANFVETFTVELSDAPDVRAKQLLAAGQRYEQGDAEGVAPDTEAAAYHYYQAAKLGSAPAAHKLAVLCQRDGLSCDPRTAFRLHKSAANLGYAPAQISLAQMYKRGEVVPRNVKAAVHWYRKAALAGDPVGQYSLGVMYERGIGVAMNKKTAFYWYKRAAKNGDSNYQITLGTCYLRGIGTAKNYTLAHKLFEGAAKKNVGLAHTRLGEMSERGLGTKQDYVAAARHYHSASLCSDYEGRLKLGALASQHSYVMKQLPMLSGKESLNFLFHDICQQAQPLAERGDPQAQYFLSLLSHGGYGQKKLEGEVNKCSVDPNARGLGQPNLRLAAVSALAAMADN